MPVLPADPSGKCTDTPTPHGYMYQSDANGVDYKIRTQDTEMASSDFATQPNLIDPRRDGGPGDDGTNCDHTIIGAPAYSSWAFYTNGGRCF